MSNFITDSLRPLGDAFAVPLILAVGLARLVGLLRIRVSVGFLIRHRGRRPLAIQVEYGNAALKGGEEHGVLDARLLSYLTADGLGSYVLVSELANIAVTASQEYRPLPWTAQALDIPCVDIRLSLDSHQLILLEVWDANPRPQVQPTLELDIKAEHGRGPLLVDPLNARGAITVRGRRRTHTVQMNAATSNHRCLTYVCHLEKQQTRSCGGKVLAGTIDASADV
jgi:hypothetical protein